MARSWANSTLWTGRYSRTCEQALSAQVLQCRKCGAVDAIILDLIDTFLFLPLALVGAAVELIDRQAAQLGEFKKLVDMDGGSAIDKLIELVEDLNKYLTL